MSTKKGRVAMLRKIRRAIQRDLELVKLNRAPEYTKTRIARALGNEPWLIERYTDTQGTILELQPLSTRITWPELQERFLLSENVIRAAAYRARKLGMHYGKFWVGSAGLFYNDRLPFSKAWKVTSGMNTKYGRNMPPICSEPITINGAFSEGFTRMAGIHVAGQLRTEDVGVIETLHPCDKCRWLMHDHPIVFPQSLISMSYPSEHPDHGKEERFTVKDLLAYHREHSGDNFDNE